MKHVLVLSLILGFMFITGVAGDIYAADCMVTCKNGSCELRNCDANATCKCSWFGNPICKCSQKGIIEEIGDVADDILTPGK